MYVFSEGNILQQLTRCDVGQVTQIDLLPDDVLLDIFDFCVDQDGFRRFIYTQIKGQIVISKTQISLECLECLGHLGAILEGWVALVEEIIFPPKITPRLVRD